MCIYVVEISGILKKASPSERHERRPTKNQTSPNPNPIYPPNNVPASATAAPATGAAGHRYGTPRYSRITVSRVWMMGVSFRGSPWRGLFLNSSHISHAHRSIQIDRSLIIYKHIFVSICAPHRDRLHKALFLPLFA